MALVRLVVRVSRLQMRLVLRLHLEGLAALVALIGRVRLMQQHVGFQYARRGESFATDRALVERHTAALGTYVVRERSASGELLAALIADEIAW